MNKNIGITTSKTINHIQDIKKEVVVKVLVETQQKVHKPVFHFEELESYDSDGAVLFIEVVIKKDGGV